MRGSRLRPETGPGNEVEKFACVCGLLVITCAVARWGPYLLPPRAGPGGGAPPPGSAAAWNGCRAYSGASMPCTRRTRPPRSPLSGRRAGRELEHAVAPN
jgi:hypothetical protein